MNDYKMQFGKQVVLLRWAKKMNIQKYAYDYIFLFSYFVVNIFNDKEEQYAIF
ncbi:MAG: hypothetical protein MI922_21850 [Bacteroidales bacterium]|nr:hypothetical protein [Bacteroidales bacterium]